MKTRSRFMLTLSAMSLGAALALAPAAFAQDKGGAPMTKGDGMKKGDEMKKPDAMTKGGDGMKKDEMKK